MLLKLGKQKQVEIQPWKTKTKKEFLTVIKNKQDKLDENDIFNILIKPYITPNDIYLSDDEIQWIMINIRNISLDNNMNFLVECSCGNDIEIKCKLMDLCKYTENQYPIIKDDIAWRDIKNKDELIKNQKTNEDEIPKIIEMLSHIDKIEGKSLPFSDIVEYNDDLPLNDGNKMLETYDEIKSTIVISYVAECPNCKKTKTFKFENIPNFFDPLLPKEL